MFRFKILLPAVLALREPSAGLAQGAPTVAQVGWMAGCWEQSAGRRLIEEQWMRPRAGGGAGPPLLPTAHGMMEIVPVES